MQTDAAQSPQAIGPSPGFVVARSAKQASTTRFLDSHENRVASIRIHRPHLLRQLQFAK